ncbi:hypothetical protein ACH5RR_033329 [Cinchona calisaya]|uniref:Ankyrin repeat family protein n=1 Tax=Cinchona calisaya TaxID=153742 RepID=A0ABD2YQ16_9GENT
MHMMKSENDEMTFYMGKERNFIASDRKDEFVALVKGLLENNESGISPFRIGEIIPWICKHQAKDCAAALITGETGLELDLNVALVGGEYPLHLAAHNLSLELVKLFLQHGARDNVVDDDQKLPLMVALDAISCHDFLADWTAGKSIYKLVYVLCLWELRKPLDVAKLLSTDTEVVRLVANQCVKEGKLVQLAALLMVAREKLLEPLPGYESDGSVLGLYIMKNLESSITEKFKLMAFGKIEEIRPCERMRRMMLSATLLLQIFERAGGVIEDYSYASTYAFPRKYAIAADVANLLRRYGFLKEKWCITPTLTYLRKEETDKLMKFIHMQKSLMQRKPVELLSNGRKASYSTYSQLTPPVPCHLARTFNTCSRPNAPSGFRLFKPVENQVNGSITRAIHPLMPKIKTAMHLCLVMRRI